MYSGLLFKTVWTAITSADIKIVHMTIYLFITGYKFH